MKRFLCNLCVVNCAGLSFVPATSPAQGIPVVKIAHVGPITGPQAHYGKDNENGARMAIDELNAQGVTIGGRKVRLELVPEDDAADPKQGSAVARKLCDARVAGVVGHLNSATSIPAAKIYSDCGIPGITPSATSPMLTQPGYKTAFRVLANDDALGTGLALHAANNLKLRKVAVVDDRTVYGQGVADVFKKTAKAKGVEIVDEQHTSDRATDFTAILTSIRAKNPDAIFYGGMDPQAGLMLRQMDELGLSSVKFLGGDGICTANLAKLSAGTRSLENVICAEGGAPLERMPRGKEWKAKYDAKYPGQFQLYSPYTYDATLVLVDAMKRAGSWDPKVYGKELSKTRLEGVTGKLAFDARGELQNPAITLYSYSGGQKHELASSVVPPAPTPPAAGPVGENRTVTTFFATDRKVQPGAHEVKKRITNEWGDLRYGIAQVNIPPGHKMGEVERPHWLAFWRGEELSRHMVLTTVDLVETAQFFARLNSVVNSRTRRSFIFVHGYNVSFEDAALRTAQMAVDLKIGAVPVFYSWPSKGSIASYTHDEQSIEWTEKHLGEFLEVFANHAKVDEIYVIAHSMGSRAATRQLAALLERRKDLRKRFRELVLAAPDIDARVFKEQILPRFPKVGTPVTMYASSDDKALLASVKVHGKTRAGLAGSELVVAAGMETVDASSIDTDFLGHSKFVASRDMLSDITLLINDSMRAARRPMLEGRPPSGEPRYWSFRR